MAQQLVFKPYEEDEPTRDNYPIRDELLGCLALGMGIVLTLWIAGEAILASARKLVGKSTG